MAELAPQVNDNADFGPNEVSKQLIKETSKDAGNPFDTAAPGDPNSYRISHAWGFCSHSACFLLKFALITI